MRFFFLLALCFALLSYPAVAQDGDGALPEALQTKKQPVYEDAKALHYKLYQDCLTLPLEGLSRGDREFFCGCYSHEVHQENLSDAALRRFVVKQGNWRALKDKMIFGPYAKCMAQTAKDFTINECYRQFSKQHYQRNVRSICECMGDGVEDYFHRKGFELIAHELQDHPDSESPIADFIASEYYRSEYRKAQHYCLRGGKYTP